MQKLHVNQLIIVTDETGEEVLRRVIDKYYSLSVAFDSDNITVPLVNANEISLEQFNGAVTEEETPTGPLVFNYNFDLNPATDYTNRYPTVRVGNAVPVSNAAGNGLEFGVDQRYTN